jgi:hypothetical protein
METTHKAFHIHQAMPNFQIHMYTNQKGIKIPPQIQLIHQKTLNNNTPRIEKAHS